MKTVIANSKHMTKEDAIQLLLVVFASLLGLAVVTLFIQWVSPTDGTEAGLRPFLLALALTIVYSSVMGGVVFLLHPRKGWLLARIRNR